MSDEDEARSASSLLPGLDEEAGPLPGLSEPAAQALTWRVVERWSSARASGARAEGPAPQLTATEAQGLVRNVVRRHARRRLARAAVAASFVLGAGGLAFGAVRVWERVAPTPATDAATELQPSKRALSKPPRRSTPALDPNSDPNAASTDTSSASTTTGKRNAPELPSVDSAPSSAIADTRPTPSSGSPNPNGIGARPGADTNLGSSVASASNAPNTPSLERANALRAARAWQAAQRAYLQIVVSAADPHERYVASVAAAALCLQHTGDPQRALNLYQAALRAYPRGDLSEEIRLGIAHTQRALNRPSAEAAALHDFLAHHATSADAREAQQRLLELLPTR